MFAVLYAAYEITLGIGTGILTQEVNGLPEPEQAVGADLVEAYADSAIIAVFTVLGSIGLAAGLIGAAVALRRAYGLNLPACWLLILSIPFIALHEPPFGPIGLAMFIAAVVLLVRQIGAEPVPGTVPATGTTSLGHAP